MRRQINLVNYIDVGQLSCAEGLCAGKGKHFQHKRVNTSHTNRKNTECLK